MNDELDKALAESFAWADGSDDWLGWMSRRSNTMCHAEKVDEWKAVAIKGFAHCKTLAAAVRSLRETVKAKDEEIARLKSQLDDIGKWHAVNPSLDQALNENDGVYKP